MASLIVSKFISQKSGLLRTVTVNAETVRYKGPRRLPPRSTIQWKFEWDGESLASRGFLRPLKPYEPPADVGERLKNVCETLGIADDDSMKIEGLESKFNILVACEKEFNYSVPSSRLHRIETIGDIRKFYETPVHAILPFDAVKKLDLPKNLHIQYDYHRFHPSTDTKFNGKTAFPRSSTIVTGLTYKKKYKSLSQKNPYES